MYEVTCRSSAHVHAEMLQVGDSVVCAQCGEEMVESTLNLRVAALRVADEYSRGYNNLLGGARQWAVRQAAGLFVRGLITEAELRQRIVAAAGRQPRLKGMFGIVRNGEHQFPVHFTQAEAQAAIEQYKAHDIELETQGWIPSAAANRYWVEEIRSNVW